jgi:hypothetical protein
MEMSSEDDTRAPQLRLFTSVWCYSTLAPSDPQGGSDFLARPPDPTDPPPLLCLLTLEGGVTFLARLPENTENLTAPWGSLGATVL